MNFEYMHSFPRKVLKIMAHTSASEEGVLLAPSTAY